MKKRQRVVTIRQTLDNGNYRAEDDIRGHIVPGTLRTQMTSPGFVYITFVVEEEDSESRPQSLACGD